MMRANKRSDAVARIERLMSRLTNVLEGTINKLYNVGHYQTANCLALAVGNDNTENAGFPRCQNKILLTFFCGGDDGRGTPAVPFFCPSEPQQFL